MKIDGFRLNKVLWAFLNTANELNLPVVFYKLPESNIFQAILGMHTISDYHVDFEQRDKGFVFSPFNNFNNNKSLFIRSGLRFRSDTEEVIFDNTPALSFNESVISKLKELLKKDERNDYFSGKNYDKMENLDKNSYEFLVKIAIKQIENEQFDKVVLARRKRVKLPYDFNVVDLFLNLCEKYKNDFTSFVSVPEVGTWMGSTPETLMTIEKNKIRTISLAGTIKAGAFDNSTWTSKEYIEQELVTKYVDENLRNVGFLDYQMDGPRTIQAGKVLHLKTVFTSRLKEGDLGKCTLLLNQLHPTPAVCGLPKKEAYHFIEKNEAFSREYYAGYLGPTWIDTDFRLFVNLRCVNLYKNYCFLYSGAGITKDSIPEKEKKETDLKFQTMENALYDMISRPIYQDFLPRKAN